MTTVWAKLDDHYPDHPKVVGLTDAAFRLHVSAICYSARHLTDGVVPTVWFKGHESELEEIIAAGLGHRDNGTVTLHDWHDHNPSSEQVRARRAANRERNLRRLEKARSVNPNNDPSRRESRRESRRDDAHSHDTPVPVPVPMGEGVVTTEDTARLTPSGFDEFWAVYPKRVGKGAAIKAWGKLRPLERQLATVAAATVKAQFESAPPDRRRFVKDPATWLNAACWDDDPSATALAGTGAKTDPPKPKEMRVTNLGDPRITYTR